MTLECAKKRLKEILETMDVPEQRLGLTDENFRWMARNLGARNSSHRNYKEAIACLKKCLMVNNA